MNDPIFFTTHVNIYVAPDSESTHFEVPIKKTMGTYPNPKLIALETINSITAHIKSIVSDIKVAREFR